MWGAEMRTRTLAANLALSIMRNHLAVTAYASKMKSGRYSVLVVVQGEGGLIRYTVTNWTEWQAVRRTLSR